MTHVSKTSLLRKIEECESEKRRLDVKIQHLRFTFELFFPESQSGRHKKRKPLRVRRGSHPHKVKYLLKQYPFGLTPREIIEKLTEENYHITIGTLSSVLKRDGGKTFVKADKMGKATKIRLRDAKGTNILLHIETENEPNNEKKEPSPPKAARVL